MLRHEYFALLEIREKYMHMKITCLRYTLRPLATLISLLLNHYCECLTDHPLSPTHVIS